MPDYSMLPNVAQEAIQEVDNAFQKVSTYTNIAVDIGDRIQQTILDAKQMQFAMQKMDLQVELMCKDYDLRIEKNKLGAEVLQMQLTNYSGQMDQLLSRILAMDPTNNNPDYIRFRSELISSLNGMSANISNMFMNFILC